MDEMTVAGHTPKVEQRTVWVPAYGNSEQPSSQPWLVCGCGWEKELSKYPHGDRTAEQIARLEHFVVVLDSKDCPECSHKRSCPQHCPKANQHAKSQDKFCPSCGLEIKS